VSGTRKRCNLTRGCVTADFQLILNEKLESVEKEIDALGEMAAQALRLQASGYSYAEIQDILGSNANALKTMVSRGRSQVKKNLGYNKVA
jgi:DNA-directed RNA polymerase specialized sigma24 family protein